MDGGRGISNLSEWAHSLLTLSPERTLFVSGGERVSSTAFHEQVSLFRGGITRAGIMPDQIVAVACERNLRSVAAVFACFCDGALPFLFDPRQDPETCAKLFDSLRISGLVLGENQESGFFASRLPYLKWSGEIHGVTPKTGVTAQHVAGGFLLHTAGTCGLPRAFQHSAAAVNWQADALIANLRLKPGLETWFTGSLASPANFSFALCATLKAGGTVVLDEPENALHEEPKLNGNQRILVMAQARDEESWNADRLLKLKGRLSSILVTDFPLTESYCTTLISATDGVVWSGFSTAECAGFLALNTVPGVWPVESVGRPLAGSEIVIFGNDGEQLGNNQPGRLAYKFAPRPEKVTSLTFQGKEQSSPFTFTGDWALVDDNDFLYILGNEKALFFKAGFIVKALEIEDAIRNASGLSDAVVFAVHDDETESEIAAVVSFTGETTRLAEAISILESRIPRYKVPERLAQIESFSRTPSGKKKRFGFATPPKYAPVEKAAVTSPEHGEGN